MEEYKQEKFNEGDKTIRKWGLASAAMIMAGVAAPMSGHIYNQYDRDEVTIEAIEELDRTRDAKYHLWEILEEHKNRTIYDAVHEISDIEEELEKRVGEEQSMSNVKELGYYGLGMVLGGMAMMGAGAYLTYRRDKNYSKTTTTNSD